MSYEKIDEADIVPPPPSRWGWWLAGCVAVAAGIGGFALWNSARQQAAEAEAAVVSAQQAAADLDSARAGVRDQRVDSEERVRRLEFLLRAARAAAETDPANAASLATEMRQAQAEIEQLRNGDKLHLSERREQAAVERTRAGDFAAAENLWREALALQQEVNRTSSESLRNLDRELRLQQELARAVAEPMEAKVHALLEQAGQASRNGRWPEALAKYHEARQLQERLNREFPRTRYSDLAAIARIDAEIAALSDHGLAERVEKQWDEARHTAAVGNTDEAARNFLEAAETQRLLNERFPKSRFVSMEKLAEIDADRQTALAAPRYKQASEFAEQARLHLRRRQIFQAQTTVKQALEILEELRSALPRARGADEVLRLRLSFLNLRSGELATLQDRFYEQIVPLPGESRFSMLRTELSQLDYARIMSTNPSRTGGRQLPVESVSWAEAEEFCRRLSWVLGVPVRLPTRDEMRSAARAEEFQQIGDGLAEWLSEAGSGDGTALVWTGTSTEAEAVARSTRAPNRGFRVVAEIDLTSGL